jgi:hypothetical protein
VNTLSSTVPVIQCFFGPFISPHDHIQRCEIYLPPIHLLHSKNGLYRRAVLLEKGPTEKPAISIGQDGSLHPLSTGHINVLQSSRV